MTAQAQARALAGRRLWVGIPGPDLDAATRRHLEDLRPGGIVLFRRNITSESQTTALVRELRALLGARLLVSVDQEHGLVLRFDHELTVFPGNMALGAAGVREPALPEHLAAEQGRHAGAELRALGIDVNLAPCCDLATRSDNPGLGVRSFGAFPALAARLTAALVRGQTQGGVLSTLKHFPGLGDAALDSHLDLPIARFDTTPGVLDPFVAGIAAGAALVMSTHVVLSDLDPGTPATFSRAIVTDLLRGSLGFRGVAITDDLEMGAMTRRFGFDEVVRRASEAGHEILCICHDFARQTRARDLLAEGHLKGAIWAGDAITIAARLDGLRPPDQPAAVVRAEARALAIAIAGRPVTIVRDDRKLVPIAAQEPVLLVLTAVLGETLAEDPLRGEDLAVLRTAFEGTGCVMVADRVPTEAQIDGVLAAAVGFRRVIVATTLARFVPAQAALVRRLARAHDGVIVVALRNPFDLEVVPAEVPATLVTAYGFRPVHQRALVSALRGESQTWGKPPVVLRPDPA